MEEEKAVSGSFMVISEEKTDSLYPMIFGVSCAFFALRLLPEPEISDEKWSEIRNRVLKGSALVGFLVWTVQRNVVTTEKLELLQKVENAQIEITELKQRRSEDAKANEKVVSIFAGREQSWFDERRKLREQIGALMNDLRRVEAKKEKSVAELGEKMKEIEVILQLKDKMIEEAERRRLETEVKLKAAEDVAEELRQNVKREAERHSSEISKHKTAFIELVSNQRQLEAEMGRTLRQVEAAKHEVDAVLEQKEQLVLANQRLSMEMVRMHKDLEQKDQILSAMLRKSKMDTAEKQMLLKEVKSCKAKRKQAELETARWKAVSESKHDRHSLRSMFSKHVNAKSDALAAGKLLRAEAVTPLEAWSHKSGRTDYDFEYRRGEMKKGVEFLSFVSDPYLPDGTEELKLTADAIGVEQKHHVEIDAFMEQLRQKEEKLEAYNWRVMSTELESKRLQSHVEALDHDIARLRQDNTRLKGVLVDREAKLQSVQEQLMMHFLPPAPQKLSFNASPSPHDAAIGNDTVWSRVKVVKRKEGIAEDNELQDIVLTLEPPNIEIKEGKDSAIDHFRRERIVSEDVAMSRNSTWKMDVHALGVLYKVKRLRQLLFMLERVTGKKHKSENGEDKEQVKGLDAVMSLMNRQVDRYHSLQGKIDDLCTRMKEKKVDNDSRGGGSNKRMEHFLEETFQLQRYIVATGQKLIQVQAKIASSVVAEAQGIEKPGGFNIERYAESLTTLFRETQRGLEVRISRIIGDLEGTLARDGFNTWRRL